MQTFSAVVERDPETGFYIAYVPGFSGAHTQRESLDKLQDNLHKLLKCSWRMENLNL
jgi:predicted RNase H-like HicB family nuclease